jgi:hypothetical protein
MRRILLALTLCSLALPAAAQANPAAESIFAMLNKSAADWNRGDLDAFALSYKNSPDILFMGARISHGFLPHAG